MITLIPQPEAYTGQNEEVLGKNAKFLFDELCTRFNWVGPSESEHTQPYVACDFTYTGPDGLVVPLRMSIETLPTKSS